MSKQYLYNGVKLPALPEYDQSVYPYVILQRIPMTDGYAYYFTGRATPFTRADDYTIEQPDGTTVLLTDVMNLYDPEGCFEYLLEDGWIYLGNPSQVVSSATEVIFWTNTDIYEDDGSVFLAGSEPVQASTFDLKSWLTGFALGFSGKPLPLNTGKKIVAYSYNGTVLPKLPEWDREMYPYAIICGIGEYSYLVHDNLEGRYKYVFCATTEAHTFGGNSKAYGLLYFCNQGDTEWSYAAEQEYTLNFGLTPPVWADYDVVYRFDSTDVRFAASGEPVPVYE